MPSKTVEMLIKAGIIPQNTVRQLEHWRVLEEGTAEKVGTDPVSLERDSSEAQRFADQLREQMEKDERVIRETELETGIGTPEIVWLVMEDLVVAGPIRARVDGFGRVHIPIDAIRYGHNKGVLAVSFIEDTEHALRVTKTEPRYEGEKEVALVCQLEETEDETSEAGTEDTPKLN